MTAISITPGYPNFSDTDGSALNDGYVYIGLEYQDPITAPTGAFWDEEFQIPADQPLRTSGGYIVRNGSPAAVYTGAAYSILVQNKNLVTVYNAPSAVITNVTNTVEDITQYQGAHATDPIARNDGTPLQVGDLYFNTVVNELKVWSGSTWVPSSPGSVTVEDFTGTGAQTAFNLATAPVAENNTQIYIDGVYQQKDTYSLAGATVNFSTAPPINSGIEVVSFSIASLGTVDASNVSYNEGSAGAVNTSVQAKLQENVSVKDFGAVGDGVTDDATAINAAALAVYNQGGGTLLFPKTTASYAINDDIILWDNTRVVCEGWVKRIGTGGIYDAVFVNQAGADNIYFETPLIDCNNQLGMNGIIFRRNGTNMVVNGGIIKNCKHEVGAKLGGRALNIEAGANIPANGLKATRITNVSIIDSYNGISLSGGDNQEESGCVISNISMENVDIPFTLFGNSAGYPHDGDSMSHMVSNVVGVNCGKSTVYPNASALICSDRGSNVMFSNVYFSNTAAYGATNALYYGDAHNIHMQNFVYDGDSVYGYVGFGWQEDASPVDSGYNSSDSSFDFIHNGNISTDIISVSSAITTRIQNVFFNIRTNTLTNDRPFTSSLSGNANVHVDIQNKAQNARMIGNCNEVNHSYTFASISGKTAYPRIFTLFDVNGADYDITVSTAGKLLINGTVVGTQT